MTTVSILYGFGEGPHVGQRFCAALQAAGYQVIDDTAQADIIITHSGGCLLLPPNYRAKLVVHIAPYHWPGLPWGISMGRKLWDDLRTHHQEGQIRFWTRKTVWNCTYFWNMRRNVRMLRNLQQPSRWQCNARTIVVRPRLDTFCTPNPQLLPFKPDAAFVSLPGHHDDCWRDPKPYLALLESRS